MNRKLLMTVIISGALALPAISSSAQLGSGAGPGSGPGAGRMTDQRMTRERMFGSPMMTLEERQAHQKNMWNAKTTAEQQRIRSEHRTMMVARAKEQNYKIDESRDDVFSFPTSGD